ncbi:MAG: hypothetical protein AAF493_26700 [Pseudomonadota bacterium]
MQVLLSAVCNPPGTKASSTGSAVIVCLFAHPDMFELNSLDAMQTITLEGTLAGTSTAYVMDNFYKDPDAVVRLLEQHEPTPWKAQEKPSYNGIHFADLRHRVPHDDVSRVSTALSELCGQTPFRPGYVLSNLVRFRPHEFNDYANNYWWPHLDVGYTALVYLNPFETSGTNLYLPKAFDDQSGNQHHAPWRSRQKWSLQHTFVAKYNRMVMFDGGHIHHGMAVDDLTFFGDMWRANQVFFFQKGEAPQ